MLVNESKMSLMCVFTVRSFDARVNITFNGQSVKGKDSPKLLGVTFDKCCSFTTNVKDVGKGYEEKCVHIYYPPLWHALIRIGLSQYIERQ